MTQEDKQLLIKDLCARLPYGVIVEITSWGGTVGASCDMRLDAGLLADLLHSEDDFKPYLHTMSSMTEEEKKDLKKEHLKDEKLYAECLTNVANGDSSMRGKVIPHFAADWCNKNHFDYRGLIPMGLALEALEGMYKTE